MTRPVVEEFHGCVASDGGVGAVMVVEMQPAVKGTVAGGVAAVDAHVGPSSSRVRLNRSMLLCLSSGAKRGRLVVWRG